MYSVQLVNYNSKALLVMNSLLVTNRQPLRAFLQESNGNYVVFFEVCSANDIMA